MKKLGAKPVFAHLATIDHNGGPQVMPVWIDFGSHIAIRGEAVEITKSGADPDIDRMTKKYLGKDRYPFRTPGEVRVIYEIRPREVTTHGVSATFAGLPAQCSGAWQTGAPLLANLLSAANAATL